MKREIKFRAWDGKQMLLPKDIYGDVRDEILIDLSGGLFYFKEESNGNWAPSTLEAYQRRDYILMQFAGLKDKNGKDIYEGDIGEIKTKSGRIERFTVEWGVHRRDMSSGWTVDIPSFAFMVNGKATFPISDNYLNGHDLDIIEIIGNIFSNPELLTP